MSERSKSHAIEFVMEQIEKSEKPGSEVVLGALALWKNAYGDFDLPKPAINEPEAISSTEVYTQINDSPSATRDYGNSSSDNLLPVAYRTGLVALADNENPSFDELIDQMSEYGKNPELVAEIQAIASPLICAAKLKMPAVPTPDDKKRFGRLYGRGSVEWSYSQRIHNKEFNYYFNLGYTPEHSGNALKELQVVFGNCNVSRYSGTYSMRFKFEEDSLRAIEFTTGSGDKNSDRVFRELLSEFELAPSTISSEDGWETDPIGGSIRLNSGSRYYFRHSIVIPKSGEVAYISYGGNRFQYSTHNNGHEFGIYRKYDPKMDSFQLALDTEGSKVFSEKTMSKQQILNLTQGLIDLIPMKEIG